MRIGIIALLHESNTFIAQKTTLEQFQQDTLLTGAAVRDCFADARQELGGFFAGLEEASATAVPLFAARAVPFGPITTGAFEHLIELMLEQLEAAGPLDGLLVAPHGATVCESIPDADGYCLSRLRQQVGDAIPVIGTLDAHANLSQQMVDATNAMIAYRTNPHLDQHDRGVEAARLIVGTIRGDMNPVQHAEFPPLAINIERQMTSESQLAELFARADDQLKRPQVLSNSILLGFPYADVPEMGASVLVVADGDPELAQAKARQLANALWEQRAQLDGQFISMEAAVSQAEADDGPICLLDMGDNVGGGSPGDGTHLLHAVRAHAVSSCLVCLCDPAAVKVASASRRGTTIEMNVGGKSDALHGAPFTERFRVVSLHDGEFTDHLTRHGGFTRYDQGPCAVIRSVDDRLTVLLTSLRVPPFSLVQLTSCDLNPADYQIIIAKGVNAPVAAYAPVCQRLIRVNTPGCTTADMQQLKFQHRRVPLFPFEDDACFALQ